MIHVIATIKARSGHRDALISSFREMAVEARSRKGCIEYCLTLHRQTAFPGQGTIDENELTIVEKWLDQDSLEGHMATPAFRIKFSSIWPAIETASMLVLDEVE